jgi:hypothetical protein|tara:strand:- start:229 stop:987 length:759 start_codon:yes stop_codon:yes gene_type:complete
MTTLVVTTFSEDGYHLYGKRLIETWCRYWPTEGYTLRIYAEHTLEVDDSRVEVINLNEVSPKLLKFKDYCGRRMDSLSDIKANKKQRNKVLKTVKWCHKVYCMEHALQSSDNHLIFLDGDTYTINKINQGVLESLSSNSLFSVHFETLQGMPHYETGLIIFNKNHAQIDDLKEHITSAYDSGEIFEFPKSWDGFWFAILHERRNYKVNDLAGGRFSGVFTNPTVKPLLVHEAGNDKYEGKGFNTFSGRKLQN